MFCLRSANFKTIFSNAFVRLSNILHTSSLVSLVSIILYVASIREDTSSWNFNVRSSITVITMLRLKSDPYCNHILIKSSINILSWTKTCYMPFYILNIILIEHRDTSKYNINSDREPLNQFPWDHIIVFFKFDIQISSFLFIFFIYCQSRKTAFVVDRLGINSSWFFVI